MITLSAKSILIKFIITNDAIAWLGRRLQAIHI